nr:hypothetical protein Iba_chr14eCG1620 [Ipomoea batatas]
MTPPAISFRLFSLNVVPLLTRSTIASAIPIAGAASSAPSAVEKVTCFNPLSFINLGPIYVNPVATLKGLSGVQCGISASSFNEFIFSKIPYFGICRDNRQSP